MNDSVAHWSPDIASWLLALLLALAYGGLTRFRFQKGVYLYVSALALLVIIPSAVHLVLDRSYGFSAHMVGHIVLLLICGPLLVLGFPTTLTGSVAIATERFSRFMQRWPWLGWLAGIGIMWVWHMPGLFQALVSQHDEGFHGLPLLHTASLLGAGILFSWPFLGPIEKNRMHPLAGVLYLFTACTACSLLGLFIAFAPAGLYAYPQTVMHAGFTQVICDTPAHGADDQQTAGLIMWVPCCFIYLTGALYLLRTGLMVQEHSQPALDNRLPLPEIR